MKKTFSLKVEGKNPERLVEAYKNEIKKYIKREQRKKCPQGVDYWRFMCQFAIDDATPAEIDFKMINKSIDSAVAADADSFYIEVISTEGVRVKKAKGTKE